MNNKILLACFLTSTLAAGPALRAQADTPPPPTSNAAFVQILATDPTALEGASTGAFTLIRNDTNSDLEVSLRIHGTASNGVDYATISNLVTIPAGYLAIDIPVQPIIDTVNRGNKTVILTIETNAAYQPGGGNEAVVNIIDDVYNTPNPSVAITEPTNGSVFTLPTNITVTAAASDPGATITSVSFYADDDLLGRVTNAPYTLTWTNARAGDYQLFARAVDNLNQSALSSLVKISVTEILPVVTITTPTNGESFTVHQNIPIAAEVTDANASATIASVSFYDNGRLLGTATNSPYQIVWSNAPAGFYELQAAASDNSGLRGLSKGVEVNISGNPR